VQALPADGVYATLAYINDQPHQSITNIGNRPTFGETERAVEVYIFNYNGDLYHRNLKVDIIDRLRGEQRFATTDELVKQITKDIKGARAALSHPGSD
jgi:riboflavin kinase/FMN adenylyltransferase